MDGFSDLKWLPVTNPSVWVVPVTGFAAESPAIAVNPWFQFVWLDKS